MGLDTDVPGDPASCRSAAEKFRSLAEAAGAAEDLMLRQRSIPDEEFAGDCAEHYREHSLRLELMSDTTVDRSATIGAALEDHADVLTQVEGVMERARDVAAHHGLLRGTVIDTPGPGSDPAIVAVYDKVAGHVEHARTVLADAEARLRAVLENRPAPLLDSTRTGPGDEPVGVTAPFPPPDDAWPYAPPRKDPWELPGVSPDHWAHDGGHPDEPLGRDPSPADVRPEEAALTTSAPSEPEPGPAVLTPAPDAPPPPLPDPLRPQPAGGWTCRVPGVEVP